MAQPSLEEVRNLLPNCPDEYTYELSHVSPRVIRVDLTGRYMPYQNKTSHTVYAFIKGNKVYPPQNYKTPRKQSVCDLIDLYKQSPYTTIIPKVRSLLHIK